MKVSKTNGTKEAGATRKKPSAPAVDGAFAESLKETQGNSVASPVVEGGMVGGVGSAFAVQEVPDALDRRTRKIAITYGEDLLHRLDELKLGVLSGSVSKERLTELAQNLRQKRQSCDDEKLNQIIAEIELRAEVEIAKLSRKPKPYS